MSADPAAALRVEGELRAAQAPVAAPADKPRVFFSYGHDEHAGLADRMCRDLEHRGYQVWFDKDRLLAGSVWDERIERGIDWVAAGPVPGSLVLLMTPHSVRRPDGFCLNELTCAIDRRLYIVPIMVVEVTPPITIRRIQWLDLRGCEPVEQHAAQYEARFGLLLRALQEHALDGDGLQTRLLQTLQPLSFDADIKVHLPRFTGRRWLLDAFDRWLADPEGQRILWLCGPPGSGKSAIAAWLSNQRMAIAALHACVYDDSEKANPSYVVRTLAWQLASQLPDYFARLVKLPDIDQLCRDQVPEERGTATGALDERKVNARTLFDRLIVQPLFDLPDPGRRIALLIDGLDEATYHGRNPLAEFLAEETRKLPSWVRILITSRPDVEVTAPLEGVTPLLLDGGAPDNVADVLAFADHHLRPYADNREPLTDTVNQLLLDRSEGNWLYLDHLRDALASRHLQFSELERFPEGLGAGYHQLLTRQFPDPELYDRIYRPLLDLIAATREPLRIDVAAEILGWSPVQKIKIPLAFGALLRVIDGTLRIYHRSILAWLAEPRPQSQYCVSVEQGDHEFVRWGWAQYERGVAAMSGYARRQLAAHLAKIGAEDRLVRLLTDVQFVRAVAQVGTVFELAEFWRGRDAAHMADAVRASFDELSRRGEPATARYEAAIATGELLRHVGHYETAMYLFDQAVPLVPPGDPAALGRVHHNAGWCLRHMERFELAAARLHHAVTCYRSARDPAGTVRALSAKGMCLWHTFDDLAAVDCLEQAVALFKDTCDRRGQAEVHNHLGIVYRSLGQFDVALQHLREAESIASSLCDHEGLGKCLNSIGTAQWWSGHHSEALASYARADQLNQRYNQPYVEGLTANNLGYLHLERGELEQALAAFQRARAIRQRIDARGYEMLDLSGIAMVRFRLGDVAIARALSSQAIAALDAIDTLEDLHRAYHNHHVIMADGDADERAQAARALERARELARRRFDPIQDAAVRQAILAGVPLMKALLS